MEPINSRLTLTDAPAADDLAALKDHVVRYNSERYRYEASRPIACFLRDAGNTMLAGASGRTWWGWLTLEYLWVAADHRRSGLGGAVLGAVEAEARRRGCRAAWLDTFSFQAEPFYRRQGYAQFGELTDYPAGAARHFMWKSLHSDSDEDVCGSPAAATEVPVTVPWMPVRQRRAAL